MSNTISDWVLNTIFKSPFAMAVGLALEIAFSVVGTILFGNYSWWEALHSGEHSAIISFVIFHIIGWVVVLLDWDYVRGLKRDIDPYYNNCYDEDDSNEICFVQGDWIVTASVRHK